MRILFLSTLLPGMRRTGSEVATQGFVDAMRAAGHEVTLLAYRRVGTEPPTAPGDVAVADRHIETLGGRRAPGALDAARGPHAAGPTPSRSTWAGRTSRAAATRSRDATGADRPRSRPDGMARARAAAGTCRWSTSPTTSSTRSTTSWRGTAARALAHRREARRIRAVEKAILERARELWALEPRRRGRARDARARHSRARLRHPAGHGARAARARPCTTSWPSAGGTGSRTPPGCAGSWTRSRPHLERPRPRRRGRRATRARRSSATAPACARSARCPTRSSSCRAARLVAVPSIAGGRRAGEDARRDRLRPARGRHVDRDARHRRPAADGAHAPTTRRSSPPRSCAALERRGRRGARASRRASGRLERDATGSTRRSREAVGGRERA